MDYIFFKQMLVLSIFHISLISCAYRKEGECYRKESNEPSYTVYCCDNYEMKNGTCIACGKGYISKDEGSCIPCTGNAYGHKCLHFCNCIAYQICNHIVGCINLQSTGIETTVKGNTAFYSSTPTSDPETVEGKTTESKQGTVISNQTIVIYTVCIGSLLVVITICYICVNRLRHKTTEQTQEDHRHQTVIQNVPNLVMPIQKNIIRLESIYDEIGEISILHDDSLPIARNQVNMSNEPSSAESDESYDEDMKNEDYLNPYQPIVEDYEKHDYTTVTEHCNTIEEIGIVHKGTGEMSVENTMSVDEFQDAIDPRHENPINTSNASG